MKISKTTSTFIFSIITLILAVLIFVFLLKVVENKNKHTSAVYQTLKEKNEEKNKIDLIKKNIDNIKIAQAKVNSYFVDSKYIISFIDYMESLGTENGVVFSVKNVEVLKGSSNISVEFIIKGSFSNVMKMIRFIEYSPYKIKFRSLYLNKYSENDPKSNEKNPKIYYYWQANGFFEVVSSY